MEDIIIDEEKIPDLDYYLDSGYFQTHRQLRRFGYYYNRFGQLRGIQDNSKFKFTNQRDYEAICVVVIEFIQEILKKRLNSKEVFVPLPEDNQGRPGANNIFISEDFYQNAEKCLICIQGTGEVRAGQWARYCCMNETLDVGTVIPFILRARTEGYSYIILNPNLNYDSATRERIIMSESMPSHCTYVWEKFIKRSPAKELYIIAHSAGGYCASILMSRYTEDFLNRVQRIALTDTSMSGTSGDKAEEFMRNVCYY